MYGKLGNIVKKSKSQENYRYWTKSRKLANSLYQNFKISVIYNIKVVLHNFGRPTFMYKSFSTIILCWYNFVKLFAINNKSHCPSFQRLVVEHCIYNYGNLCVEKDEKAFFQQL